MEIKNYTQFKNAMRNGNPFEIVEHCMKPEYTGQVRCVQVMQSNGMYTGIYGKPDAEISKMNNGRGSWVGFGKASDWSFGNGLCVQTIRGNVLWILRVLENEGEKSDDY